MSIYIGWTEITDIKIGSTAINSVWIGGTQIWGRLSVTTNPSNRQSIVITNLQTATAQVNLTADSSVSWSFSVVSSDISTYGTLSYGASSGTSTFVRITQTQVGASDATVDVTATLGSATVTTRVYLLASQDNFGG